MADIVAKRSFMIVAAGALLLATVAGSVSAQQEKRLALVIGNSDYADAPVLRNPVNDARAMAAKLERLHFKVISVFNGSYRDMLASLNTFTDELNRYDVGLFYYSGHGAQYQGTNYLIPVNAEIHRAVDIQFEALNANRVLADMESAGVQVNIMILDACRNNPFASQFRSVARGLSVVQAPAGSLVVYSTAPDQVASDGKGEDSPFTAALLAHMESPGVSIQDMLTRVFQEVQQETRGQQTPWESSSLTAPFYFAPRPPELVTTPQKATLQAAPVLPVTPAPAPALASAGSVEAFGRLALTVKASLDTGQARVTLSSPALAKDIVLLMSTNSTRTPSLPPGTYSVTAALSGDTGVGFRGQVQVTRGRLTSLAIPLDYSAGYRVQRLDGQRSDYQLTLDRLQRDRHKKGTGATLLTLLALAGGAGSYFSYQTGASAYDSYQAASTSTSAEDYGSQSRTYGTLAVASGVAGGIFLLWALAELGSRPSKDQITSVQASIARIDAQIDAVKAWEQLTQ